MTTEARQSVLENACVYVTHLRRFAGRDGYAARHEVAGQLPAAKGGLTLVQLELPDGRTFRGSARCSDLDNFSRKRGREIALGRAVKKALA